MAGILLTPLGFRDSGFPGFQRKKPGITIKKVADSTRIPGKKVPDSNWESGSQLGICTPLWATAFFFFGSDIAFSAKKSAQIIFLISKSAQM